jgi:hypothetical protein
MRRRLAIMPFLLSGIAGLCAVNPVEAATPGNFSPVPFERFIGPDDCPGNDQFADPYVLKQDDAWYITSTYLVGRPMYMFKTTDWKTKTRLSLSIDLNQDYLRSHFNNNTITPQGIWGFVPYRQPSGRWHAYGSVSIGGFNTFICHFKPLTSDWPITQWRLDKVLLGDLTSSPYETKVYTDETGGYLFYVDRLPDGNNHVMVRKLRAPDEIDPAFQPRPVLSPEGLASEFRNGSAGMQLCEGTNITKLATKDGPKYVMLYAVGDFAQNNYKLGVAYSNSLVPPIGKYYDKPKARDPAGIWGHPETPGEIVYLLQSEKQNWPNFCASQVSGPGLGNLVSYLGACHLVFHAHDPGQTSGGGQGRWIWRCPIILSFKKPMTEWLKPVL